MGPSASTDVKAWLSCRIRMSQNFGVATKDGMLWGWGTTPALPTLGGAVRF